MGAITTREIVLERARSMAVRIADPRQRERMTDALFKSLYPLELIRAAPDETEYPNYERRKE